MKYTIPADTPSNRSTHRSVTFIIALVLLAAFCALAAQKTSPASSTIRLRLPPDRPIRDISFANEVEHAIDRGLSFLLSSQSEAGWWSTADHPALTGLALTAFLGHPQDRYRTSPPPALKKAFQFILDSAKPDGRIYRTSLTNYNTAICTTTLALAENPAYTPIIRRARKWLTRSQVDLGQQDALDSPFDGGMGYNDKYEHSDLSNTLITLETLYYTRSKDREGPDGLDWEAAIHFIQHCQNLPSHNTEPWVSQASQDKGGFVYFPGESKAGNTTDPVTGRVALRSYGSMSYAGLLS
ncbi:MAG: hypothetical protein O7G83_10085, partial [Proteobacteria bacterium]|nr:hypothetical protein [Pseudomonadota bacterium]